MAYKDKDELLNALYDHVYGDDDPEEGDDFFDHLASFFDQFDTQNDNDNQGNNNQQHRRKRRNQPQNKSNPPRRKQRTATGNGYGSSTFFGTGN